MPPPTPTLGTLLRHLIEHLDGAVEANYRAAGLDYRPRYTPVVKALTALGPVSIRALSRQAGISHSAASQTVSQMTREGLVAPQPGRDGRERIVALTPRAEAMLPAITLQWRAVNAAADTLDAELAVPLSSLLVEAIAALERRSFGARIAQAAAVLPPPVSPDPGASR
jgi:DNA-binding MarR family transcriptional regulator